MPEKARWGDPRLHWGMPGLAWDGDVPEPPIVSVFPSQPKHRMKRQPYLPDNDPDILTLLVTLDTTLPGALATKYDVDAAQLLRLRHGRYAFGWFLAANPVARQWCQSLTDAHDGMTTGAPGPLQPLPGLPPLPPVPTFNTPPVTAQLEPGFFDFLGRLVQQIKNHPAYDEADGILLKIVGAEVPPPDPAIVPVVKWEFAASGRPVLIVPKTPFQGYQVWAGRGTAPLVEAGFSTTRKFELALPLPAPGQAEVWRVQVQYRYQNKPFGQKSQIIEIPVRGN